MTGVALPNFCRWMAGRFGEAWALTPKSVPRETFRAAKREYEQQLGCRVYGPDYCRRFYGDAGPLLDDIRRVPAR